MLEYDEIMDHLLIKHVFPTEDSQKTFDIDKVIFNDPATIVLWQDGTKTVVKASPNDVYDPEKGLAMAIAKKALGNKGNYYEVFKKVLPKSVLEDADRCHTDIYNLRMYLDHVKESDPKLFDRLMEEYSGMPGYIPAEETNFTAIQ